MALPKKQQRTANNKHPGTQSTAKDEEGQQYRRRFKNHFDREYEPTAHLVSSAFKGQASTDQTLTIALPGSILENVQSEKLRTVLVGNIARFCAIFCVHEIVIYKESEVKDEHVDYNVHMAKILQYLETPQYLRKALFQHDHVLKYCGALNPLDAPHHVRITEKSEYREGVTMFSDDVSTTVNVGLEKPIKVRGSIPDRSRVTVRMDYTSRKLPGTVVDPEEPMMKGYYWGYQVRMAGDLLEVFDNSVLGIPAYDTVIGLSERGSNDTGPIGEAKKKSNHVLLVLGGLAGLEHAFSFCKNKRGIEKVEDLFNFWWNFLPTQGSRTIRTEEALPLALAYFDTL
ncbi:hypothetical protein PCE1_000821 [Barthelona sp. PCE]